MTMIQPLPPPRPKGELYDSSNVIKSRKSIILLLIGVIPYFPLPHLQAATSHYLVHRFASCYYFDVFHWISSNPIDFRYSYVSS